MKLILIFSFLFGSVFVMNEQPFVASDNKITYEKALMLSQKNNKAIMLKLTANNCKYCIKMDKEVLADEQVRSLLSKNFITVTVNVDEEEIPFGVQRTVTPTFIFVNKKGEITSKLPGSWNKKDFLDLLNNRVEERLKKIKEVL